MTSTRAEIGPFVDEVVGLRPDRPLSFCTIHYGARVERWRFHSDFPRPDGPELPRYYDQIGLPPLIECFAPKSYRVVEPHRHTFYEIVMIRGGEGVHEANELTQPLQRGAVILIPPGAAHSYEATRKLRLTNFYLLAPWFLDYLRLLWHEDGLAGFFMSRVGHGGPPSEAVCILQLNEARMRQCEREIGQMAREGSQPHPSLFAYMGCFQKIFCLLNETFKEVNLQPQNRPDPRVWKAIRQIENIVACGGVLNVGAIARQVQMSPTHLTRLFHAVIGCPPEAYYQRHRIQSAMGLLKLANLSLSDIACQLGFADQAHFSRVFKAATGKSPGRYRTAINDDPKCEPAPNSDFP